MTSVKKKGGMQINEWLPSCPSRRSRASEFTSKPVPTHLYKFPLGILIRIREARYQPYSAVLDFKIVAILKTSITTIKEIYVVVGKY